VTAIEGKLHLGERLTVERTKGWEKTKKDIGHPLEISEAKGMSFRSREKRP